MVMESHEIRKSTEKSWKFRNGHGKFGDCTGIYPMTGAKAVDVLLVLQSQNFLL